MADIVYGVSVEYMSSGNLSLPSSVKDLEKNFGKSLFGGIGKAAGMFGGLMDSIAGAAIGVASSAAMGIGAALAGGLAAATHQAIEFNKEMEDTQTGLATIANAQAGLNGFSTSGEAFGNQYRLAGDVIKQMRKDAQELPGEFKDLQNMMALMAPAASNAGVGMFDTEKLAAKSMAAAAALRVPFATAGREMGNILAGTVTSRMPMFSKMGLGDAKDWNKLSQEDRLSKVREKLGQMEPGLASVQKNWSTISSNFVDNLKIGVGLVGGPLIDRVKTAMMAFNSSDKSSLAGLGARIGQGLVEAFDRGEAAIKKWLPIAEEFAGTMERGIVRVMSQFGPMLNKATDGLQHFMEDPAAFTKLEHAVATFAALRIGTGVLGAGASIAPSAIQALSATGAVGSAAELAGPIGIALAAAALAAYGFTHALLDSTSDLHGAAKSQAGLLATNFGKLASTAETLWSAVTPLLELLGVTAVWLINGFLTGINGVIDILGTLSTAIQWVVDRIPGFGKKPMGSDLAFEQGIGDDINKGLITAMNSNLNPIKVLEGGGMEKTKEPPKPPQHTTHIHKVEIKVDSNQDPNRIAKAVQGLLKSDAMYPKSAVLNPASQFSRQQ